MGRQDYIDVNPIEDLVSASGLITVGGLGSGIINPQQLIHSTIITIPDIYLGTKERMRIEELVLIQNCTITSGTDFLDELIILFYNSDVITLVAGSAISYDSGSDEDDVIASVKITASDWLAESSTVQRATVNPFKHIKGTVADANLGTNLYAAILANDIETLPGTMSLKMNTKLKVIGNVDVE